MFAHYKPRGAIFALPSGQAKVQQQSYSIELAGGSMDLGPAD